MALESARPVTEDEYWGEIAELDPVEIVKVIKDGFRVVSAAQNNGDVMIAVPVRSFAILLAMAHLAGQPRE